MRTVWKALICLALVVPMGAYVAGALVTSASGGTEPRQTIEIQGPSPTPDPVRTRPGKGGPSTTPEPPDRSEEVEVIVPDYDDFDDHDDRGDDDGDDHHGRGGGKQDDRDDGPDDDHSGHGGGEDD